MKIENGKTYRLTKNIINPFPDKRVKHDWRKAPVFIEGLRLTGRVIQYKDESAPWESLHTLGGYAFQDVLLTSQLGKMLLENIEPIEDEISLLNEMGIKHSVTAEEILLRLLEDNLVSREQVREVSAKMAYETDQEFDDYSQKLKKD